jgi:hypothetical protein
MSLFQSLTSFMPFESSNSQASQPSQPPSKPAHTFSMIEINGKIYYLTSLNIDDCIIEYSHTMTTPLLETITTFSTSLSNQKITTIVFENDDSQPQSQSQTQSKPQEKKVVGFWNPQLSKFVLNI